MTKNKKIGNKDNNCKEETKAVQKVPELINLNNNKILRNLRTLLVGRLLRSEKKDLHFFSISLKILFTCGVRQQNMY